MVFPRFYISKISGGANSHGSALFRPPPPQYELICFRRPCIYHYIHDTPYIHLVFSLCLQAVNIERRRLQLEFIYQNTGRHSLSLTYFLRLYDYYFTQSSKSWFVFSYSFCQITFSGSLASFVVKHWAQLLILVPVNISVIIII